MNTKADQEIDTNDDDTIVLDDQDAEQSEAQADEQQAQATEDEGDTDEVVVSIGEESPPPEDQPAEHFWAAKMRVENRELKRKARELEERLKATTQTETKPVVLGTKPKLEDHDYDADKFEEALANWFERKRQADEANAKQEAEVMTQQKAWQAKLDGYGKAKAELRVKDFEDAEAVAQELFNVTQQGVMLQGADNPALVVYALGKNPKKAQELAAIKDPVKFAFAVAKLEKDLKVTNRRAAPPPERVVSGTGRVSGAVDSTLERLREEAARTGNMTKVIQYKAQKRSAK